MEKLQTGGATRLALLLATLVLVVIGAVGWQLGKANEPTRPMQSISQARKSSDQTEGGKYLYIKEWGVRTALPSDLTSAVTYSLSEPQPDTDGNSLQTAKIMVVRSKFSDHTCATNLNSIGEMVESGAQYIRSQNSKPFDARRYRWTFKENVLKDVGYTYHLNYVTPDCLGGGQNAALIEELQAALQNLKPAN